MRYFAMIDGEQRGPYRLDQLEGAGVQPDTYVWCKGMADWQQAGDVADICRYFRQTLHDRMHPSSAPAAPAAPEADGETADPYADIPLRWRYYVRRSGHEAHMEPEKKPDSSVPPRTFLVESIVVLIMCLPITGFVALYFSLRTRSLWNAGRAEEAYAASRKARLWVLITIVGGFFMSALMMKLRGMV